MTNPITAVGGIGLPPLTTDAPKPASDSASGGFGKALAGALDELTTTQSQATDQAQQLATGQAKDISSVVMSVEKASLELQLAVQLRNKGVEAYQELFRMQV
ncbi:MAG TPA: flagellar hook-basal body complex protein FliE [Gaiellales bacterium]|jgi:flagellar hook-basal body complex protein FliE|nr:flagellar hook-basal body complex protein FliE [Gaiellales bacterium]